MGGWVTKFGSVREEGMARDREAHGYMDTFGTTAKAVRWIHGVYLVGVYLCVQLLDTLDTVMYPALFWIRWIRIYHLGLLAGRRMFVRRARVLGFR